MKQPKPMNRRQKLLLSQIKRKPQIIKTITDDLRNLVGHGQIEIQIGNDIVAKWCGDD